MHKQTGNEKMGQGKRKRGEGAWGVTLVMKKGRGKQGEEGKAEREEKERSLIGM